MSRFAPPCRSFISSVESLCWSLCGPVTSKHVPVTQDNSNRPERPNKLTELYFGQQKHLFLSLSFPHLSPLITCPPFHFDGYCFSVCRVVGLQDFHFVSQNSSGTQYPVYQLSAVREPQKTALSQKFRTNYSTLRSQSRSTFSPPLSLTLFSENRLLLTIPIFSSLFKKKNVSKSRVKMIISDFKILVKRKLVKEVHV